jgi:hypothetical protein
LVCAVLLSMNGCGGAQPELVVPSADLPPATAQGAIDLSGWQLSIPVTDSKGHPHHRGAGDHRGAMAGHRH